MHATFSDVFFKKGNISSHYGYFEMLRLTPCLTSGPLLHIYASYLGCVNETFNDALLFRLEEVKLHLYLLNTLLLGRCLSFPELLRLGHRGRIETKK